MKLEKEEGVFIEKQDITGASLEEMLSDSMLLNDNNQGVPHLRILVGGITIKTFLFAFIALCCFLVFYVVYLFVLKGEENSLIASHNAQTVYHVGQSRGEILAVDGTVLVSSKIAFHLMANPSLFESEEEIKRAMDALSHSNPRFHRDIVQEKVLNAFEKNLGSVLLLKNLDDEEIAGITDILVRYSGLSLQETSIRFYPYQQQFAHILGYMAEVSYDDIVQNNEYALLDQRGKQGVELYYEDHLRGKDGIFVKYKNEKGVIEEEELLRPVEKGGTVTTTLMPRLQQIAYEELSSALQRLSARSRTAEDEEQDETDQSSGAVVVLDPRTGAIRASVSIPSFNPNDFSKGLTQEQAQYYFSDSSGVFFNRVTSGLYPSGSVVKPLIAVAALEEDIIDDTTVIHTKGSITVESIFNPDVSWTFLDWKDHGPVDMRQAIAVSSNAYFYAIGGGYNNQKGLGIDKIVEWLNAFHWGKSLGITFDNEVSGRIPTPQWKEETQKRGWYIGDTYNTSIGQGDLVVTPLQIATAISAIANGGTLYKPFVVSHIEYEDRSYARYFPDAIAEGIADSSSLAVAKQGMRNAVIAGSSTLFQSLDVPFAGKTGTAQIGRERNHALFVGFGPYDDPEFVIVVLLEKGQNSVYAVQVARAIFQRYYQEQDEAGREE